MDPIIVQAIITAIATVICSLLAFLPPYLQMRRRINGVAADAAETRNQVQNTHETNLREDFDVKHKQTHQKLDLMVGLVQGHSEDIRELRKADTVIWSEIDHLRREKKDK